MTITNDGLKVLMDRFLNGTNYSKISKFKVGIDNTEPSSADTDLIHSIPLSNTEQVDNCETADWTDSSDCTTSLNSSYYKQGSNGLNLTKDGTSSTECSTSKTTTSLDFTDKELSVWLYIKDSTALGKLATTALTIRFGSDSSNYYEWTKDSSDLTTGWNLIDGLTSSNGTATGTPTLTACDYSYIKLTSSNATDTWSDGDFVMDDWKLISSEDYIGDFESGYPEVDETNKEITYRIVLNSTEANGYNLKEIGLFNTDTSRKMWSRNTFTGISKSNTEEIRVIIKDRFSAN